MTVTEMPKPKSDKKVNVTRLVASILACEAIGGIGSIFTIDSVSTWYNTIQKPFFTPPNWLFGPVWTTLFFLTGISVYLLWTDYLEGKLAKGAFWAFGTQLALNILWTAIFFGLHLLFAGLVEILILWAAIAFTIALSYRVNKAAGLLLVPYIAWVTIATLLNYYVWLLNP